MFEEVKKEIHDLHDLYVTGLSRIAEWNKFAPYIQQTEQYLAWMENTIDQAPAILFTTTDETLLDYLTKSKQEFSVFNSIPQPVPNLYPLVNTSGSALSTVYQQYVSNVAIAFREQPDVTNWASNTCKMGDELREKYHRSEIVHQRLIKLNPSLGNLHDKSIKAAFAAKAKTQDPIGAAAVQNRLLEQFKGALIAKCRSGKGTDYKRISDNLAANSALTKTVVSDGQHTYDTLNDEYVDVRKSIKTSTGDRMVELLRQLEDHIIGITDALDPGLVGVSFF